MIYSPVLGHIITNNQAIALCQQNNLNYLVDRIQNNQELYRSWVFDGVSGLPDVLMSFIGRRYPITYQCALPHDLAYAYGDLGENQHAERKFVDQQFRKHLMENGEVSRTVSKLCYLTVRLLGSSKLGLSFTWGFANRSRFSLNNEPLIIAY